MSEPLLSKMPNFSRFSKEYRVNGFPHLKVEAQFDDPDHTLPRLTGWMVIDTRFTVLDRYARWLILFTPKLSHIRSWIRAGGVQLWDPEKRKQDRDWRPEPDGWTSEKEGSEFPGRTDSGVRNAGRVGSRSGRGRGVRPEDCGPDIGRDLEFGEPAHRQLRGAGLKRPRYAVAPGWITSENDRQRHWIGFGALTWLYGVDPAECLLADGKKDKGWSKELREGLIWLYPQYRHEDYEALKEELARGDDAFKLVEP